MFVKRSSYRSGKKRVATVDWHEACLRQNTFQLTAVKMWNDSLNIWKCTINNQSLSVVKRWISTGEYICREWRAREKCPQPRYMTRYTAVHPCTTIDDIQWEARLSPPPFVACKYHANQARAYFTSTYVCIKNASASDRRSNSTLWIQNVVSLSFLSIIRSVTCAFSDSGLKK